MQKHKPFFSLLLVPFLCILFCLPVSYAEIIVNTTNIGTKANPQVGNGIAPGDANNTITNNAEIAVTGDGINTSSGSVTNNGTVYSSGASAIETGDGNDTLINNGSLEVLSSVDYGITMGTGNDTLTNNETITIYSASCNGINLGTGSDTVNNNGRIDIIQTDSNGIVTGNNDTSGDTFTNAGTISIGSAGCHGIKMSSGDDIFTNSGTITVGTSDCNAIDLCSGDDTFTNSGTVIITEATFNGMDFGDGEDTFTNTGTLDITADNVGINLGDGSDTFTNSGELLIESIDGGEGIDILNLEGNEQDRVCAGPFFGFEYLHKNGTGTWTLNGPVQMQTSVDVNKGALYINDTLTPIRADGVTLVVTVFPDAILGGDGTISGGNVINNGTLAPGASVGTLTISGDYIQNADSTLEIEIEGSTSDKLDVSGTATINSDSTVKVIPSLDVDDGKAYTILTAGTLAGVGFQGVTVNSKLVSFVLDDQSIANTVQILASRQSYNSKVGEGQKEIADILDKARKGATGNLKDLLLDLENTDQFEEGLKNVSPANLATLLQMGFISSFAQAQQIALRLNELRVASNSSHSSRFASVMTQDGPVLADIPLRAGSPYKWSVWGRFYGQMVDQDNKDGKIGYEYNTYGPVLGIDRIYGDNLIVGVSGGYGVTDLEFNEVEANTDLDAYFASIYGSYFEKDRYYIDSSFSFSSNTYETSRIISAGSTHRNAESEYKAKTFSSYIGGGYYFPVKNWNIIPVYSLQYVKNKQEDYIEYIVGVPFMVVDDSDAETLLQKVGVRCDYGFTFSGMQILSKTTVSWGYQYLDTVHSSQMKFAESPSGSFTIQGLESARNSVIIDSGFIISVNEQFDVELEWDTEVKEKYLANNFWGGVRYKF